MTVDLYSASVRFSGGFAFSSARASSALENCASAASRFTVAVEGSALFSAPLCSDAKREWGTQISAAAQSTVVARMKTGETRAKTLCKKNAVFSADFMPTKSPNGCYRGY